MTSNYPGDAADQFDCTGYQPNEALTNALVRTLHGATVRGATDQQVQFHYDQRLQAKFIAFYEARNELLDSLREYPGFQESSATGEWEPDEAELALDQFTTWFTWGN